MQIKNYKKALLPLLVLYASGGYSTTFKDSLQKGMYYSPLVNASIHAIESSSSYVGEARSGYLPSLQLSHNNRLKERGDEINKQGYSVDVTQTLFDFGITYNNITYAKYLLNNKFWGSVSTIDNELGKISTAYLNILKYSNLIEIAESHIKKYSDLLDLVEQREFGGIDNKGDVSSVKLKLMSIQSDLRLYRSYLYSFEEEYRFLVGEVPTNLSYPDFTFLFRKYPTNSEEFIKVAPEIISMEMQKHAAKSEYDIAKKGFLPRLSLKVSHGKGSYDRDNDTTVSLNVESDLFDGGATYYRAQGASERIYETKYNKEQRVNELSTEVKRLYNEALTGQERIPLLKSKMVEAENIIEVYKEQFLVGRRSLLDLVNSVQDSYINSVDLESTEASYRLSLFSSLNRLGLTRRLFNIKFPLTLDESEKEAREFIKDKRIKLDDTPEKKKTPATSTRYNHPVYQASLKQRDYDPAITTLSMPMTVEMADSAPAVKATSVPLPKKEVVVSPVIEKNVSVESAPVRPINAGPAPARRNKPVKPVVLADSRVETPSKTPSMNTKVTPTKKATVEPSNKGKYAIQYSETEYNQAKDNNKAANDVLKRYLSGKK